MCITVIAVKRPIIKYHKQLYGELRRCRYFIHIQFIFRIAHQSTTQSRIITNIPTKHDNLYTKMCKIEHLWFCMTVYVCVWVFFKYLVMYLFLIHGVGGGGGGSRDLPVFDLPLILSAE